MSVFKLGDKVARSSRGAFDRTATQEEVIAVHKKYLVLSDGSKWTHTGRRYGGSLAAYATIEHWDSKHDEMNLRSRLSSHLALVKKEELAKLMLSEVAQLNHIFERIRSD